MRILPNTLDQTDKDNKTQAGSATGLLLTVPESAVPSWLSAMRRDYTAIMLTPSYSHVTMLPIADLGKAINACILYSQRLPSNMYPRRQPGRHPMPVYLSPAVSASLLRAACSRRRLSTPRRRRGRSPDAAQVDGANARDDVATHGVDGAAR